MRDALLAYVVGIGLDSTFRNENNSEFINFIKLQIRAESDILSVFELFKIVTYVDLHLTEVHAVFFLQVSETHPHLHSIKYDSAAQKICKMRPDFPSK